MRNAVVKVFLLSFLNFLGVSVIFQNNRVFQIFFHKFKKTFVTFIDFFVVRVTFSEIFFIKF